MADYDGITEREEGKAKMPLGMTVLFLGLIIFGLIYIYRYLPQISGWSQAAQYEAAMQALQAMHAAPAEHEASESAEHEQQETLVLGAQIFSENCAVCHGKDLAGGIGPSLLGPTFRYGASMIDHIRVISKGTTKGMPSFEAQLGSEKIHAVAAFIDSRHVHR